MLIRIHMIVDLRPFDQANPETHRAEDPMSQDIVISERANKEICEAVGCFAQATEKIEVKVGEKGTICLYLCSSCVGKFA
jgi:hypothetical protein